MNIPMMMEVTKKISECPCCGDKTVGNGSKFIVEDDWFERSCRECGWEIKGRVENNEIIIESDNASYISAKKQQEQTPGNDQEEPQPSVNKKRGR